MSSTTETPGWRDMPVTGDSLGRSWQGLHDDTNTTHRHYREEEGRREESKIFTGH